MGQWRQGGKEAARRVGSEAGKQEDVRRVRGGKGEPRVDETRRQWG